MLVSKHALTWRWITERLRWRKRVEEEKRYVWPPIALLKIGECFACGAFACAAAAS